MKRSRFERENIALKIILIVGVLIVLGMGAMRIMVELKFLAL